MTVFIRDALFPSKIRLFQSYEVRWIHVIDAICIRLANASLEAQKVRIPAFQFFALHCVL